METTLTASARAQRPVAGPASLKAGHLLEPAANVARFGRSGKVDELPPTRRRPPPAVTLALALAFTGCASPTFEPPPSHAIVGFYGAAHNGGTFVRTVKPAQVGVGDRIVVTGTGLYDGTWTVLQAFPYQDPSDPQRLWGYRIEPKWKGHPPGFGRGGVVPTPNVARLQPVLMSPAAATGAADEKPYDFALLDQPPVPTFQARPQYPPAMQQQKIPGEVVVDFIVDRNGDVQNPYALRSSRKEFEPAAIAAVRAWKFKPGRKHGRPVPTHMIVPIVFTVNEK